MKKTTIVSSLVILSASLAAPGCTEAVTDGSQEDVAEQSAELTLLSAREPVAATLATLTTKAGTKLTFLGGDEDELALAVVGTVGRDDLELDTARREADKNLARLYETLANAPAPAALRDAVARASEPRFTVDASDEGESAIASGGGGDAVLVSPAQPAASSGFCDIDNWAYSGSGKFKYCWPNQYGEPWVKRKGDHMACRFDVVQGPTHVRARYKNASGWHTAISIVLGNNQFMQFEQDYRWAKRWRECKTVDNPYHRKLHFRVVGHDNLSALPFNPVDVDFP